MQTLSASLTAIQGGMRGESFLFQLILVSCFFLVLIIELVWFVRVRRALLSKGYFSEEVRDYLIWALVPFSLFLVLTRMAFIPL